MICIGIDQSYEDTGIAIAKDGKIKNVTHIPLKNLPDNHERRRALRERLQSCIYVGKSQANRADSEFRVVFERIRLKSRKIISFSYIKAMGGMCAVIVDVCMDLGVPVYSADTNSWKAAVIGTRKQQENPYRIDPRKWPTIVWCNEHGYEDFIRDYGIGPRRKKGVFLDEKGRKFTYNDNKADSIGIALYGCMPDAKLEEER